MKGIDHTSIIKGAGLFLLAYGLVALLYGLYHQFFIPIFIQNHLVLPTFKALIGNYRLIPPVIYFLLVSLFGMGIFFLKENARRILIMFTLFNLVINFLKIVGLSANGSLITVIDGFILIFIVVFFTRDPVKKQFS